MDVVFSKRHIYTKCLNIILIRVYLKESGIILFSSFHPSTLQVPHPFSSKPNKNKFSDNFINQKLNNIKKTYKIKKIKNICL